MLSFARSLAAVLAACTLTLYPAFPQPPGLPAKPSLPQAPSSTGEDLLTGLTAEMRNDLLSSLAAYPDDVLGTVFQAAQYAPLLKALKAHPTDRDFNSAASYLYNQQPELLEILRENPLSTQVVGLYAKRNPEETWKIIDQYRRDENLLPDTGSRRIAATHSVASGSGSADTSHSAASGSTPEDLTVSVDTASLESSMDDLSSSVDDLSSSVDDYTAELDELNTNIDEAEEEAEELQAKADEIESLASDERTGFRVGSTAASTSLGKGASPFGGLGGGSGGPSAFGFGRSGQSRNSPQAFSSKSMNSRSFQSQMNRGNKRSRSGLGRSESGLSKAGSRGGAIARQPSRSGSSPAAGSSRRGGGGPGGPGKRP